MLLSWCFSLNAFKNVICFLVEQNKCQQICFETMQIEEKFHSGIICRDQFTGPVCVTFPSIFNLYGCVQSNSNLFEKSE